MDQHEVDRAREKLTAAADDVALWGVVIELARAKLDPDTWPQLADLVRPVLAPDLAPELRKSRIWQLSLEGVPWFRTLILETIGPPTFDGDDGGGDPMAGYAAWVAAEMQRPNRWLVSHVGGVVGFDDAELEELLMVVELEDRGRPSAADRPEIDFELASGRGAAAAPPEEAPAPPPAPIATAAPSRPAYPLIDCPPVWVTEEEQQVTIGLTPKVLQAVGATGLVVAADEATVDDLTVTLLLDPRSVVPTAGAPRTYPLPVTAEQRFPSVTVGLTALSGPDLALERRIGLHFRRGGRSVGLAWRRVATVDSQSEVAGARAPAPPSDLLDLSSLVDQKPPDLVLAAYRGDDTAGSALVWEAFSARDDDNIPDPERSPGFSGDAGADFASRIRSAIESGSGGTGVPLLTELQGIGVEVARAMPAGVLDLLRRTAARPDVDGLSPTVLLLTEDPSVPWELAVPKEPALASPRTTSPFLGAHVAISRWPLVPGKPRPVPRSRQDITAGGVLSAAYDQVKNWPRLKEAEAEAGELLTRYGGTPIEPRWTAVRDCLEGQPPVDWLHVALHGKFDVTGAKDGLVLLDGPPGSLTPQFFKTTHIDALTLSRGPFVFLNACQVGSGNTVLGNYGGMAVSLLRAGASAVVAAMWNVDDTVAAAITERFYAATLPLDEATPVPAAEALRRERASYTEEGVTADPTACTPTLLAYQLHGHPGLTLSRTPPA